MELKRRFDLRIVFATVFGFAFLVYLIIGLMPARAIEYEIDGQISIPKINLVADVVNLQLEDGELNTPDTIVGKFAKNKNKTLFIGHSSTVFAGLKNVRIGDTVNYGEKTYEIVERSVLRKSNINMGKILQAEEDDTIIIMTCAGKDLGGGDASHRLIIRAVNK